MLRITIRPFRRRRAGARGPAGARSRGA
jgi:hypothetical protein